MIARFADEENGGFFETSDDHEQLVARRKDLEDHPIPSGNSSAAYGLLRLGALTGEHEYERRAESALRLLHQIAAKHPQAFAHLLQALDFRLAPVREVALVATRPRAARARAAVARSAPTSCWPAATPTACPCSRAAPPWTAAPRPTCASASPAGRRSPSRRSWHGCSPSGARPSRAEHVAGGRLLRGRRHLRPRAAAGGERRRGACPPAHAPHLLRSRAACGRSGIRGAGTRAVPQCDRDLCRTTPCLLSADRDGAHRFRARRARGRTTMRPASGCSPPSRGAWPESIRAATSGWWPPARRSGSTPDRPTTSARWRSPAGRERTGRGGACASPLSLDEVGRDRPFWLRSPAPSPRPRRGGRRARAPPAERESPCAGCATRARATPTTASSSCSACRARSSAWARAASPAATCPATGPRRLSRESLRLARRVVERALQAP